MRKDPSLQFNYTGLMSHPRKMKLLEICTGVRTRKRQGGGKRRTAKPRQIKRLSEETCEKKDGDRQSHTDKKRTKEREKKTRETKKGKRDPVQTGSRTKTARHTHTLNERGRVPERHTQPNTESCTKVQSTRGTHAKQGRDTCRRELRFRSKRHTKDTRQVTRQELRKSA